MFLRRFPQYLTVACLALSLLLFRHDQRVSTAMCADIAVFHLIGIICSFVGNDKTRLNSIMWIVWALVLLGVSVGVFFLSRTDPVQPPLISPKVQKYPISQAPAMNAPVQSAVEHAMITIPLANGFNIDRQLELHNSLYSATFDTNVYRTRRKVEMDEMGNAQYQIQTLKVDDPIMSSLSLVFLAQPTPIVSFTLAMPTSLQHVPNSSLVEPSQVQTTPPTVQPTSSPPPDTLSVNNQKITRKLPHSQYLRVSNQPQYVETSNFSPQSPVEAVERTPLKESSTMHKCESSAGSHQISLCIRTSQESRVCVTSKRSSRREKRRGISQHSLP
ncbi:hypothetical protein BLNAU_12297 [Blattamonas nauphoetae]|uniref:Uncharacterized protein n=1 Tax=Blattamonas nauphoetae TaxID=2049346 RepID=A0ABQ9XMS3_9EUKA|nr:hypothetical protein BLNAU_12297 [Blattamonas nauphoetae]